MPPLLPLLLCTAFVLFLLWLERRASRGASMPLWIPTLWMMMVASRPLGDWCSVMVDNDSGSMLDRLVLASLTVTAIVVLARRRVHPVRVLLRQKWFVALLLCMLASTLWSDITLIALRRWARELIILPMALLILSELDPREALVTVVRRCAYALIPFSLVLIKYYPTLGREYGRWSGVEMWTGVTIQKNQLGRLCMLTVFFLGWEVYQRWRERPRRIGSYKVWADVFIIFLALCLLTGSDSATSKVTLMLGVAGYIGLRLLRRLKLAVPQAILLALVIFLMAFGASAPFVGGANVAGFTESLGRDSTLTGRTEIWAHVLPARAQRPLLGYGLGSFWTDTRRTLYHIPNAHNGYLELLLELGEVGLVFYAIWLLSFARQLHRALPHDYEWASFAICLLLMALVYNISESALNSFTDHMTAVMTMTSLVALCRKRSRSEFSREPAADVATIPGWHAGMTLPELPPIGAWREDSPAQAEDLLTPAGSLIKSSHSTAARPSRGNSVSRRHFGP